ncbi:MAG: hypothetical protein INR68_00210 [Methylobacterium mesophilicum]|nr:hypothetical protein [Methylobacterium mesophilicum]
MNWMKSVFCAAAVASCLSVPGLALAEVYIRQLDQSQGANPAANREGASAYIPQVPSDTRPRAVAPPARKVVRRKAARTPVIPSVARNTYPDVGAGVAVALSPAAADARLPNVGRGVVRQ